MADPKGFLTSRQRELPTRRPVPIRLQDWREVYEPGDDAVLRRQAGRCMDCGIPFCHNGCPLGNLIPEWNDLTWRGDWREAIERLHATNNFPEFTGRRGQSVARVTSAVALAPAQEQRLTEVLGRLYGRAIGLQVTVDPSVLGGLVVQVGDEVIDGSIAHRLEAARRRLAG